MDCHSVGGLQILNVYSTELSSVGDCRSLELNQKNALSWAATEARCSSGLSVALACVSSAAADTKENIRHHQPLGLKQRRP